MLRSSIWLYVGSLFSSLLGYLYWAVASRFVASTTIGLAATILSFQSLLLSIFSLGLPAALKRYIGLSIAKNDFRLLASYFFTSLLLLLLLNLPITVILLLSPLAGFNFYNLTSIELFYVALLLLLSFWSPLFHSLFNSLLRSQISAFVKLVSSVGQLLVGVFLLIIGYEFLGIMIGFFVASLITDIMLLFFSVSFFRRIQTEFKISLPNSMELLQAGAPSWVPNVLTVLGKTIGVMFVFGFVGRADTGLYYIALVVASFITWFPTSIHSLMFPTLSSMRYGHKEAALKAIRLSLVATVPAAFSLMLYPFLPLSLLGPDYLASSNILRILILEAIIAPITLGYTSYVYAIGRYLHVTAIGLVTNISRLVLYTLAIVALGATGAALAYITGTVLALVPVFLSGRRLGFRFDWLRYIKALSIPALLVVVLLILNIHWIVGIPLMILVPLLVYPRIGIVTKDDVMELARVFLSKDNIKRVYSYARPIIKILFGE